MEASKYKKYIIQKYIIQKYKITEEIQKYKNKIAGAVEASKSGSAVAVVGSQQQPNSANEPWPGPP